MKFQIGDVVKFSSAFTDWQGFYKRRGFGVITNIETVIDDDEYQETHYWVKYAFFAPIAYLEQDLVLLTDPNDILKTIV